MHIFKRALIVTCSLFLRLSPMTSYSRPGVAAAARLATITDPSIWERVVKQYKPMLLEKKGEELLVMDDWCETLGTKLQSASSPCITKNDLIQIIQWKFAKGKPRPYMNKIKANTDTEVKECSILAFAASQGGDIDGALDEITKLKGVGVAGASAILSLHRPDLVAFMDDEVIEALYSGKRAYTKAIFDAMNERCTEIAESLGKGGWTPRKVGVALWTAARVCASKGEDLKLDKEGSDDDSEVESSTARTTKRRRKS